MVLIPFVFPGIEAVRCAFQMRGGQGAFAETVSLAGCPGEDARAQAVANRKKLAPLCGFASFAEVQQVHGDVMVFEPEPTCPEDEPAAEGDGLATGLAGRGLMIKTADCQSILLAHSSGRYIAALHAGWRGNRMEFPVSGARAFCERYGLEPRDLHAVRGPSLGPSAARFTAFESEWGEDYRPWFDTQTWTMNLWQLTRDQLTKAGLPQEHIYGIDICTFSAPEAFFSYRREKVCGRQCSLIWRV